MTSQHNKDEELQRREQELRDREHALRLREIEAELSQPSLGVSPTVKHTEPESAMRRRLKKLQNVATFFGIVVVVAVAVKIANQLAMAVIVGGIAWVAYKMFFEGDRAKR